MEASIYHILPAAGWQQALEDGAYRPASLPAEGFIHCSTAAQVIRTANLYYAGQSGLLLLEIDPGVLAPELHWENTTGGTETFPHIYGPLNLEAVHRVYSFEPGPDGLFTEKGVPWTLP